MYCPKCGYQVPAGAAFCPNCGAKVQMEGLSLPLHRRMQPSLSLLISRNILSHNLNNLTSRNQMTSPMLRLPPVLLHRRFHPSLHRMLPSRQATHWLQS